MEKETANATQTSATETMPSQTTTPQPNSDKPKSSNKILIILGLVGLFLVVVVIAVAVLMVFANQKPATDSNTGGNTDQDTETDDKAIKISVLEEGKLILPVGYADPSIVKTATGYRMYVNRQSGGPGGILIYKSTDGKTWTKETDIVISGASTGRAIAWPDGGVRVYYPGTQPIRPTDPVANMFSTYAADGVTFKQDPGIILAPRSDEYYVQGPTVFQLADNTWRMYFHENTLAAGMQADGEIWGASSSDGITWKRDSETTITMDTVESSVVNAPWKQVLHPFVLKNPEGGYIMFYNTHSEMFAATSEDGVKWDKIGSIGIHGADLDGYFQEDGTIRVFYGDFDEAQGGGLVYMGVLEIE